MRKMMLIQQQGKNQMVLSYATKDDPCPINEIKNPGDVKRDRPRTIFSCTPCQKNRTNTLGGPLQIKRTICCISEDDLTVHILQIT